MTKSSLSFLPVTMRLPLKFGAETIHSIQIAHVELEAFGSVGHGKKPLSTNGATALSPSAPSPELASAALILDFHHSHI